MDVSRRWRSRPFRNRLRPDLPLGYEGSEMDIGSKDFKLGMTGLLICGLIALSLGIFS